MNLASADPQQKTFGRLPDGRAYRVDANGLELVDYLAELEVTQDDLQRQVRALEDELVEKNRMIDHLAKGQPLPKAAVKEQAIIPTSTNGSASKLAAALTACQTSLAQANTAASGRALACDFESAENPYREKSNQLQAELQQLSRQQSAQAQRDATDEVQADGDRRQLQVAKERITSQQQRITEQDEQIVEQQTRLKSLDEQVAKLEAKLTELATTQGQFARAALAQSTGTDLRAAKTDSREAEVKAAEVTAANRIAAKGTSTSTAKATNRPTTEALALARSEFREDLQKIQELIGRRKSLFDSAGRKGSGVSIRIQPLVTKENVSLDSLRLSVDRLDADSDIFAIRKGLGDIKTLLAEDIGVLSRLGKL